MRVLIVDDELIVVESCRRILEAEGAEVIVAEDVDSAQAILNSEEQFDLLITDIKMPKKEGFHLINYTRSNIPETAILMMTGYLTPETVAKGRTEGADRFIAKPFTPDELLEAVNQAIGVTPI